MTLEKDFGMEGIRNEETAIMENKIILNSEGSISMGKGFAPFSITAKG
jgi:hypothetical protein